MANLSSLFGGGIQSVQEGYVDEGSGTKQTGTGKDAVYWDIAITALTDYTKAFVVWEGGMSTTSNIPDPFNRATTSHVCMARLTSNTNLRIYSPFSTLAKVGGNYQIVEFK